MLEKVELLIACGESEVITGGSFSAFLCSKRRVGENQAVALHGLAHIGQRIAINNLAINAVEHGVHQRQTVRVMNKLAAGKGFLFFKAGGFSVQREKVIRLLSDILAGGDHKAESTASGIVAAFSGLWLHQFSHNVNQHTGSEILPCAGFLLIGVLL